MSKIVMTEQSSAPDTPGSGKVAIYVDTNGSLCWRKDDGVIVKIASVGTYTLTIPATGTAALLGTAQTFSAAQTFGAEIKSPSGTPLQLRPGSNATNAVQIQNAGGTAILTVDTINSRVAAAGRVSAVGTSDLAHVITATGSDGHTVSLQRFVRRIALTSLGTKLIIPVTSQGSWNTRVLLSVKVLSAATNYSYPLSGGCRCEFSSLTSISNLAAYDTWGNYKAIAANGMNVEIEFTTAYIGGSLEKGVLVDIEYLSMAHTFDIIAWNSIALN